MKTDKITIKYFIIVLALIISAIVLGIFIGNKQTNNNDTSAIEINIDGKILKDFYSDIHTYKITLDKDIEIVPEVIVKSNDSSLNVQVISASDITTQGKRDRTTTIEVTDESGVKTTYDIIFEIDGRNYGKWVTGDFHNHTKLTDGRHTAYEVFEKGLNEYGLDWMANSEHGGMYKHDQKGKLLATGDTWRWITLKENAFDVVNELEEKYNKPVWLGIEWNMPFYYHVSMGIVSDDPTAVSDFEYIFDAKDYDKSRSDDNYLEGDESKGLLPKNNLVKQHAIEAIEYLGKKYGEASYAIINHPSLTEVFAIDSVRDFNNINPDIFFGFEAAPGHQKEPLRGTYRTYGGFDYMVTEVGGFWDALLGEGRHFWIFANSDFHNTDRDFWPGEYAKNYYFVEDEGDQGIIDGMRSGNGFVVHGDLINALDFYISSGAKTATMGETLKLDKNGEAQITARFKTPEKNNNGGFVEVDHIDIISGKVTGLIEPGSEEYEKDTNESTKVIKTFMKDEWTTDEEGWFFVSFDVKDLKEDIYFRLRGTNHSINTAYETDEQGNPLVDIERVGTALEIANDSWGDLWFYSNPIFVNSKD